MKDFYDVVVIGSGLAGLTGANYLAKLGHSVLLLEQHFQLGGLATWFKRARGHIFDVSLHGFPVGMIKSCRKYWSKEIADAIVPLRDIRFMNPQFNIQTTFDKVDFTKILCEKFHVAREKIEQFFAHLRGMNFYDDDRRSLRELFEEYFPGRGDVHRLLLEPITYANGFTLDDPAIAYGIVFSNFMSQGVYTFEGGTDHLITAMERELLKNGVTIRKRALVQKIDVAKAADGRAQVCGVQTSVGNFRCRAVLSNANLKRTILELVGRDHFSENYQKNVDAMRINTSSCQVYIGIRAGESIPDIGDLIFISDAPKFSSNELLSFQTQSRTFSVYYPKTRPQTGEPRYAIVASLNARWRDWESLSDADYEAAKKRISEETITCLEKLIPGVREKIDWLEVATPRTFAHYTRHVDGASFGTKFEGLTVSSELPKEIRGLWHAGSVGIIMSGWLGAINYGVITANAMDRSLSQCAAVN